MLNGLLRHILTAAGGALVARGSLAESELDLAVGAVRHCIFSTGPFVEPITVWDEPISKQIRVNFSLSACPMTAHVCARQRGITTISGKRITGSYSRIT